MQILKASIAGTMESSDIMVRIEPGASGVEIDLNSTVEKQFGKAIRRVISETLAELGVENAKVTAVDKGALDCTIKARVKTAACRAGDGTSYRWGGATE